MDGRPEPHLRNSARLLRAQGDICVLMSGQEDGQIMVCGQELSCGDDAIP